MLGGVETWRGFGGEDARGATVRPNQLRAWESVGEVAAGSGAVENDGRAALSLEEEGVEDGEDEGIAVVVCGGAGTDVVDSVSIGAAPSSANGVGSGGAAVGATVGDPLHQLIRPPPVVAPSCPVVEDDAAPSSFARLAT